MKLSKEVKVGLLVTSALAALFWGANYLKGIDVFSGSNHFYAVYTRVDGLVPSSDVLMNGVKVGQVEKLKFTEDRSGRVVILLRVSDKLVIGKNTVARIFSSDLLGGRAIELVLDGSDAVAVDGDTLRTDIASSLSDQMEPLRYKAERLIDSLDSLAMTMKMVFDPNSTGKAGSGIQNINKTLDNIESLTASLDRMVTPADGKLRVMIANMESISTNLKNHSADIGGILENLHTMSDSLAGANLASTINHADKALAQTAILLEKVNNGEGTLGQLANNDSLYNALAASAAALDSFLVDLKANPNRYVHFSMFGKKAK